MPTSRLFHSFTCSINEELTKSCKDVRIALLIVQVLFRVFFSYRTELDGSGGMRAAISIRGAILKLIGRNCGKSVDFNIFYCS